MKKSKRLKLLLTIMRSDDALLDRVEALLNEPAAKPEPEQQEHEPWFGRQRLNTLDRQRAEREEREAHIEYRNHDWQPAQLSQW